MWVAVGLLWKKEGRGAGGLLTTPKPLAGYQFLRLCCSGGQPPGPVHYMYLYTEQKYLDAIYSVKDVCNWRAILIDI